MEREITEQSGVINIPVATSAGNFKWFKRLMDVAVLVSTWSKDPSTRVGAVATRNNRIIAQGYNGFPSGADDSRELLEDRSRKYPRTVHAEANVICMAAKEGISLAGSIIYITHFPCATCAGLLIQAGVSGIVVKEPMGERWFESCAEAYTLLRQSDVFVMFEDQRREQK